MKKCLFLFLLFPFIIKAQDLSLYQKKIFVQHGDTMPYRILLPENYDAHKKYPLLIFLHGSGERGNDNELQLLHGGGLFLKDSIRKAFPAIVVFPQCAQSSYWSNVNIVEENGKRTFNFRPNGPPTQAMVLLQELIHKLRGEYKIEKKRIYVGGLSMGGMGTQEIVRRNPRLFAAAFSICGGAHPATAPLMVKTPWWFFHGAKDDVVNPQLSINMAQALTKLGATVKLNIYPEANHNSWDSAFAEPGLLPWVFAQHK